jgi:hypothetical protein
MDDTLEFPISFDGWTRALMTPLLTGPSTSRVLLTQQEVHVAMGAGEWAFSAHVPRASIVSVALDSGRVTGWGAHGWRGRWLVNGSSRGLVRIDIDPPAPGRCAMLPLKIRQLRVSLEDPEGFIAAVTQLIR